VFQYARRVLASIVMARQPELFPRTTAAAPTPARAPLAERMRPRTVDEFAGQRHLLGPGRVLRDLLAGGRLESLILWGPPGTGKTTLARLLGTASDVRTVGFSAVLHGVKELRQIVEEAEDELRRTGKPILLFVDEIHRLNKAQQDAFLPHVERGTIILVGATTENPSFEVIPALLSRTRVLVLEPLTADDVGSLVDRALTDAERGLGRARLTLADDARTFLVEQAQGDARVALGTLEVAAHMARARHTKTLDLALLEEAAQHRALRYDKAGEEHYNVISAFIKSMRGGDPDAAVYWLMRMLEAGEDPLFVARRMVIFAAEDVGNAEPQALAVAVAAKDAVHFVGLPEGRLPLAQAAIYLATCPKSNAAMRAMVAATADVRAQGPVPVPLHLRNAPTPLMQALSYGVGYEYPHDHPDAVVEQDYLPDALRERRYYEPTDRGHEREIAQRLRDWRRRRDPGTGP
jgi:putative ATPase